MVSRNRLVLGRRRLEACHRLGWDDIPAVTVAGIWEALDYLEAEHAGSYPGQPLTIAETMGMDAAIRELQWWPRRAYNSEGRDPDIGNKRKQRIAAALGLNAKQYLEARELWQAARGYKETLGNRHPVTPEDQVRAARAFAAITSPSTIPAAYRQYREGGPDAGLRELPAPAPVVRRPPQRAQAMQIQQGLAHMTGTLNALMSVGVPAPELPAAQREEWAASITDLIHHLSVLRRRIR